MIDLILFAGQSNMAGRGVTCARWPQPAPQLTPGAGWEFRAVSDPTRLYPIGEPFGVAENRVGGINDCWGEVRAKTGSMVTAFVNAYYAGCGVPVVGVSASKGGSSMAQWQPGGDYLTDALSRLDAAGAWLKENGYTVRRTLCLWCQGETDGDEGTADAAYVAGFDAMLTAMKAAGIQRLLMVRIGQCNIPGSEDRYLPMLALQDRIVRARDDVAMVSGCLAGMRERGLMKDSFHYYQQAYNEAGTEAGSAAAKL